jgi:hypothetical protein
MELRNNEDKGDDLSLGCEKKRERIWKEVSRTVESNELNVECVTSRASAICNTSLPIPTHLSQLDLIYHLPFLNER